MYQIGDYIKHHRYGVCTIVDKTKRKNANKETKRYYVLKTINGVDTKITTPVDSPDLVNISSMDEVNELLAKLDDLPDLWIKDNAERQEKFKHILHTGNMIDIASLCNTIYLKKKERNAENKALPASDARILASAEKKLQDELAYILDTDFKGVEEFIRKNAPQRKAE